MSASASGPAGAVCGAAGVLPLPWVELMPVLPTRASNTLSWCGTESWWSWSPPVVSSSPLGAGSFGGTGAVGSGVVSSVSGTEWSSPVESSPGVVVSVPSSLVEVSSESAPGVLPVEGPAVRGRPEPPAMGAGGGQGRAGGGQRGGARGQYRSCHPGQFGLRRRPAGRRVVAPAEGVVDLGVDVGEALCRPVVGLARVLVDEGRILGVPARRVGVRTRAVSAVAAAPGSCDRTSRRSASSRSRPLLASSRSALSRASRARTSARSASNLLTWAVT